MTLRVKTPWFNFIAEGDRHLYNIYIYIYIY